MTMAESSGTRLVQLDHEDGGKVAKVYQDTTEEVEVSTRDPSKMSSFHKWLVICICGVGQMVTLGFVLMFAVFLSPVQSDFNLTYTQASMLFACASALLQFCGPLASACIERFGYKISLSASALVAFASLFVSSFMKYYVLLVIFWGIIPGASLCVGMTAVTLVPGYLIEDNQRHIAFSIIFSGAGIGLAIMPHVFTALIETYTWQHALMIISTFPLHLLLCAAVIPEPPRKIKTHTAKFELEQQQESRLHKIGAKFHIHLWKQWKFIVTFIACFTLQFCGVGILVFMYNMLTAHYHLSNETASTALLLHGLASIAGRLTVMLIRKGTVARWWIWTIFGVLFGFSIMLFGVCTSIVAAFILEMMIGALVGIMFCLHAVILTDIFDVSDLPATFGYSNLAFGCGSWFGPPFAGLIRDATNSYTGVGVFLGTSLMVVHGVGVVTYIVYRFCSKPTTDMSNLEAVAKDEADDI